jgi:hypothetical protein
MENNCRLQIKKLNLGVVNLLKPEDKYGLLPEVPEHVADDVLKEGG